MKPTVGFGSTDVIQHDVATANQQTLERVGDIEENQRKQEATQKQKAHSISELESRQDLHGSSMLGLEVAQETLHAELLEARQVFEATASSVEVHTPSWGELNTIMEQQSAQMKRIEIFNAIALQAAGLGHGP